MPSWRDEYVASLQARDQKEQANLSLFANYAKLADRTATLQATCRTESQAKILSPRTSPKPQGPKAVNSSTKPPAKNAEASPALRQELAEAQRSRGVLETRLQMITDELQKLKIQSSLDAKRLIELTKERDTLVRRLKDRDEEIKGKAKLVEDVHDETISLTLQLNMADERARKLGAENKELVERWMKRMGEEADHMNEKSKFS